MFCSPMTKKRLQRMFALLAKFDAVVMAKKKIQWDIIPYGQHWHHGSRTKFDVNKTLLNLKLRWANKKYIHDVYQESCILFFDSCFVIRNWCIYITMNLNIIVNPDALNMKFFDREMNYCLLVIIENYSNIYYIYDYDIALCMCWVCIVCNHSLTKKNTRLCIVVTCSRTLNLSLSCRLATVIGLEGTLY